MSLRTNRRIQTRQSHCSQASLTLFAALLAACSAGASTPKHGQGGKGQGDGSDSGAQSADASAGYGNGDAGKGMLPPAGGALHITPGTPMLTVTQGKPQTIDFKAAFGAQPAQPVWSISRAEIGTIDPATGHFVTGSVGGEAQITADAGTVKVSVTIVVTITAAQNGSSGTVMCAAGGCDGVGGEGPGPAVSAANKKALDAKPTANATFVWLYPYEATVFPLGLLAPLLQWDLDPTLSADAVKLELSSQYYSYTGYFARPAKLATSAPFVHHPIPDDVWDAATHSAARSTVHVKLTLLVAGKAIGPIQETWKIAGGALKGTVYYQSYGTDLVKNEVGAMGGDGRFGGATLAIRGGSTAPTLVAGVTSDDKSGCRVCHTVSADGSRMVVQHGDPFPYVMGSSYALNRPGYPETPYADPGLMGWAGLSPDGSIAVGNGGGLMTGGANDIPGSAPALSQLLDANTGKPIASTGLTTFVTKAMTPMFSPDGTHVAFAFHDGPGDAKTGTGSETKLVTMDFDAATNTFSNPDLVYEDMNGGHPGWPAFMPTNEHLVFQMDLASGDNHGEYLSTRFGKRGELWWVNLKTGKAHALNLANGKDAMGKVYLPTGPNSHDHDSELAYEPTVSPIASGGYAWVVFTSRRMYGNIATIDPKLSDPRDYDHNLTPTTKKLWVAAIDLPASGAELQSNLDDPSHPAFYLPAQELYAGNARGFWVPDPCRANGKSCESGDQCCNGYCSLDAKLKMNVCGGKPPVCAQEFDRCVKSTDCCKTAKATFACINGHCASPMPE